MAKRRKKKRWSVLPFMSVVIMGVGLGLVFASGLLVYHNNQEAAEAGAYVQTVNQVVDRRIEENPMRDYLSNPEFVPDYKLYPGMEMPTAEVDGQIYVGQLSIPALDLELSVQSEWSYPNLKKSPCRYVGTPYQGTFAICAHNYTTHFGPIKNLSEGDRISFTDMDGNIFEYVVHEVDEIQPIPDTQVTKSGYDLVLFTCTLGGRTRVVVYCDAVTV